MLCRCRVCVSLTCRLALFAICAQAHGEGADVGGESEHPLMDDGGTFHKHVYPD